MLDKVKRSMTFRSSPADLRAAPAACWLVDFCMAELKISERSLAIATALIALIDKSFMVVTEITFSIRSCYQVPQ